MNILSIFKQIKFDPFYTHGTRINLSAFWLSLQNIFYLHMYRITFPDKGAGWSSRGLFFFVATSNIWEVALGRFVTIKAQFISRSFLIN